MNRDKRHKEHKHHHSHHDHNIHRTQRSYDTNDRHHSSSRRGRQRERIHAKQTNHKTHNSRSRSRESKHTHTINTNLYGLLFRKEYQWMIANNINALKGQSTFENIYNKFKQMDTNIYGAHVSYAQVLKEFDGSEKMAAASLKKLLLHFMDKKTKILQPNQQKKMDANQSLRIGNNFAKFQKKMSRKFKSKHEASATKEDRKLSEMRNKNETDIKIKAEPINYDNIADDPPKMISQQGTAIKSEFDDVVNMQKKAPNEIIVEEKHHDEAVLDKDVIVSHVKYKHDKDIIVTNLAQAEDWGLIVKFCPRCKVQANRTEANIANTCSVMVCTNPSCSPDGVHFTYWCWNCSSILTNTRHLRCRNCGKENEKQCERN